MTSFGIRKVLPYVALYLFPAILLYPVIADDAIDDKKSAEHAIQRTPVRIAGKLQSGFVEREVCRTIESIEECNSAIVHEATGTILSMDGFWISSCQANRKPVKGQVDTAAYVHCLIRTKPGTDDRPPLPSMRQQAITELGARNQ